VYGATTGADSLRVPGGAAQHETNSRRETEPFERPRKEWFQELEWEWDSLQWRDVNGAGLTRRELERWPIDRRVERRTWPHTEHGVQYPFCSS